MPFYTESLPAPGSVRGKPSGRLSTFMLPDKALKPVADHFVAIGGVPLPTLRLRADQKCAHSCLLEEIRTGCRSVDAEGEQHGQLMAWAVVREAGFRWGLKREDIFVATSLKAGRGHPGQIVKIFEAGLVRLGLTYVDLCLLRPEGPEGLVDPEAWQLMAELKTRGRLRLLGLENFSLAGLERLAEKGLKPDLAQLELHPHLQQKKLSRILSIQGIPLRATSPLGRGRALLDPLFRKMTLKYDKTPAQIVLRWHLESGRWLVSGAVNPVHIRENNDIFDFHLDPEDMRQIALLNRSGRTCA